MLFWISSLFAIALAVLLYYYIHIRTRTEAETDEHFMGSPYGPESEIPMSRFVAIGLPAKEVVAQAQPAGGNPAVYFKETVSVKEIENALDLATTAKMQEKWGEMHEVSRKHAAGAKTKVIALLEDALALLTEGEGPRFRVRGAQVLNAASPNGNLEPFYYSRWDVAVHRGNKQYGYAFESTFLHIDDGVHLCAVENIVALAEDAVEMITALPGGALKTD